jgi:chromosome partitioning protein
MRGRRRDRDKASHQEKQDSPVEVEPVLIEQGVDEERTEPTVSADGTGPEAESPVGAATESEEIPVVVGTLATDPAMSEPEPAPEPEPQPAVPNPAPEAITTAPAEATIAAPKPAVVTESASAVRTESEAPAEATQEGKPAEEGEFQSASHLPLPRIIAVANQKGGVGKTTTSVNLGAALAELGFRVLVIDLDPQGNATTGLGVDARNFERSMYDVIMRDDPLEDCIEPTNMKNLFVAPATIDLAGAEIELVPAFSRELKLKRAIETVIDDFDYVLIDCPPSLGLITVNGLAAAAEVLVPIQCEYYALEGLSQLLRNVHLVASNLNDGLDVSTIVLTMYDARTKLSDQVASEVREHFGAKVCRNVIPRTVRLSEAPSFGQPISVFDPTSRGAIAYRELAKEVSGGAS